MKFAQLSKKPGRGIGQASPATGREARQGKSARARKITDRRRRCHLSPRGQHARRLACVRGRAAIFIVSMIGASRTFESATPKPSLPQANDALRSVSALCALAATEEAEAEQRRGEQRERGGLRHGRYRRILDGHIRKAVGESGAGPREQPIGFCIHEVKTEIVVCVVGVRGRIKRDGEVTGSTCRER